MTTSLATLRTLPLAVLPLFSGCQTVSPSGSANVEAGALPQAEMNFDDCLITHMAAAQMLMDSIEETDDASAEEVLLDGVIDGQTKLLSDDRLDEDELAQRTATLMRSYAGATDARITEAEANNVTAQTLAAKAAACAEAII